MTKPKILIVDDESIVADGLLQQLLDMGYQPVGKTAGAEEAILLADRLRPDLVLIDLHLAGEMSGITAAQIIHDRYAIPVVFMTADADNETLEGGNLSDPFGYILKPFEGRGLRMVMEMALYKHRAEILMQQDRQERAAILSNSLDGFWLVESPGRLKDVNEACCRMHGFTREEMLGRPASDFESEETTNEILGDIARIKQNGGALYEGKHRHKDGHLFDVEVSINALPGDKGLYSSFLRDITVRKQLEAALRSSEEQAIKTFRTIPDGIILSRIADGRVLEVNEAFARLSGWSREEVIGRSILELNLWDQPTERDTYFDTLFQKGRVEGMEAVFRTKSGERRVINLSAELMDHNQEKLVLAVAHDITRRKELELSLRQAEERTRKAFQTIPDGIVISRMADSVVLEVNDSFCELSGLPREAVIGRTMPQLDLWDKPSDRDLFIKGLQEHGRVSGLEAGFHNQFGAHRVMALSAEVMNDNQEQLVLIVTHDVTERKQAEEALLESEATYRSILNASPDDITITDMKGRILLISAAATAMFGYESGEEVGKQLLDFVVPEDVERARANLALMYQEGAHPPNEYRGIRKDRSIFDIEVMSAFIRGKDHQPNKMVFIVRDITERKHLDAALRENEDRYRDLLDNSQEVIATYDLEGNFKSVNETAIRVIGYSREALLNMNLMDLIVPEMRHLFPDYLRTIRTDGKAHGIMKIQTFSGAVRLWEFESTLRTEGVANPLVRGMAMDITERKQIEQKLRENQKMLLEAQFIAGLGSYVLELPSGIWSSSQVLDQLFGIDDTYPRTIEGWAALIHPDDQQLMADYFANEVVGKRQRFNKEYRIIRPRDQAERWVHGQGELAISAQDLVLSMHGTIQDITERKRTEQSLREQTQELTDRNLALTRFNRIAVDRELRMIELKREVNELCGKLGEPPRHRVTEDYAPSSKAQP